MASKARSDEELAELSQRGSSEAEAELIERYGDLIGACGATWHIAGLERGDVEAEAMIAILGAMRNYNPEAGVRFQGWAKLRCTQHLSKIRAKANAGELISGVRNEATVVQWKTFASDWNEHENDLAGMADPRLESVADEMQLAALLEVLSARQQKILRWTLLGLSFADIGFELGVSKQMISREAETIRVKAMAILDPECVPQSEVVDPAA